VPDGSHRAFLMFIILPEPHISSPQFFPPFSPPLCICHCPVFSSRAQSITMPSPGSLILPPLTSQFAVQRTSTPPFVQLQADAVNTVLLPQDPPFINWVFFLLCPFFVRLCTGVLPTIEVWNLFALYSFFLRVFLPSFWFVSLFFSLSVIFAAGLPVFATSFEARVFFLPYHPSPRMRARCPFDLRPLARRVSSAPFTDFASPPTCPPALPFRCP